jgi:hypothetical protein
LQKYNHVVFPQCRGIITMLSLAGGIITLFSLAGGIMRFSLAGGIIMLFYLAGGNYHAVFPCRGE